MISKSRNTRDNIIKNISSQLIIPGIFLLFYGILWYFSYRGGLSVTESPNTYFSIRFWLMIISPLIFFMLLIIYIILIIRNGLKYFFYSIGLFVIFFLMICFFGDPLVSPVAKGYYKYVKSNLDINKIHKWLINYKNTEDESVDEYGTKQYRVFDYDWPESIKNLNPSRGVLICENKGKKYIRISHGVDWELSVGLCVMEEPMDVPEWGHNFSEKRIKLSDTAFVWAGD